MIRIADAIEDGRADALAGITARTQVEQLDSIMKAAIYRADHKAGGYDLTQKNKGRRILDSDLQFIERPGESRWISGAKESLIRAIDGKRGAPRLRSDIQFSEKYNPEIYAKLKEILSDAEIKSAVGWGSVEEISDASRLARAGITNIAQPVSELSSVNTGR